MATKQIYKQLAPFALSRLLMLFLLLVNRSIEAAIAFCIIVPLSLVFIGAGATGDFLFRVFFLPSLLLGNSSFDLGDVVLSIFIWGLLYEAVSRLLFYVSKGKTRPPSNNRVLFIIFVAAYVLGAACVPFIEFAAGTDMSDLYGFLVLMLFAGLLAFFFSWVMRKLQELLAGPAR